LREARLFHRLRVVLLRMRNAREEHVRGTEVDLLAETRMLLRFIEPVELEQQRAEPQTELACKIRRDHDRFPARLGGLFITAGGLELLTQLLPGIREMRILFRDPAERRNRLLVLSFRGKLRRL